MTTKSEQEVQDYLEMAEWIDELKGAAMDGIVEAHEISPEKENTMGKFVKWPSTEREHKKRRITEKIDGTNACIVIWDGVVGAQSRNRIITPDDDNAGFAKWVYANAGALKDTLGYGYHYGEWFGEGIQKNPLGIEGKRFALFDATKYLPANGYELDNVDGLETVPLLFEGDGNYMTIPNVMTDLETYGSRVKGAKTEDVYSNIPGLDSTLAYTRAAKPEGIIVWHGPTQTRTKILLENDGMHKWEAK